MTHLVVHDTYAHYQIRARLGEGGMGEVYLAHDLRLRRPVALKVLKPHDRSAESIDAFVREARAASALNHPHVAHIYEIGTLADIVYIAMEYVEGETLERRLAAGPMPIGEIVTLATQLADALADAGAKGIVHRDLKPANIIINRRDEAKILDFGIARMARDESQDHETDSVVGTVPYMSPEQVRGKDVDPRSDLFSFGVILHEMVTGRRPFDADTAVETFLRIAQAAPPRIARDDVPDELRNLIDKCLEKNRDDRYASAAEVLAELRSLQREGPRPRRLWMWGAAALALLAAALVFFVTRKESHPLPSRLTKLTSAPGLQDEPAISPDGMSIAYTSDERGNLDVFVRPLSGGEAVRITDSPADDAQPAWSPDGTRIAFVSARDRSGRLSIVLGQALGNFVNAQGGDLFIVSASGGDAVKLIDNAFYPAWSPDGAWIVFQSGRGGRWDLWKIAASGGMPVQLTRDREFDYQPSWSPDGKRIVYASGMPEPYRLRIIDAGGGAQRTITDGKDGVLLNPVFSADGTFVVYSSTRGGSLNLWRLAIGSQTPERITLGEGDDVNPSVGAGERVLYASIRQTPDLWTLDVASGKAEQLTFDTGREEFPHRSIGGVLAFASDRGGDDAIWLRDGRGEMRVLAKRANAGQPRWSPDAKRIAYRYFAGGFTTIGIQEAHGSAIRVLARNAEAPAWSPDGTRIAYTSWDGRRKSQIFVTPVDAVAPRQITSLDLTTSYPTWSPDGKFVSFQATRDDGTRHVWIAEVATGRVRPLTSGASEDSHPQWSPSDPDRILFIRNHANLMTVSVRTGEVRELTTYDEPSMVLDYPSWSPDGTKVDFSIARKRGDLFLLE